MRQAVLRLRTFFNPPTSAELMLAVAGAVM